jgi:hypothetical protein
VVTRHNQLQSVNYEAVGRTTLGLESNGPLFEGLREGRTMMSTFLRSLTLSVILGVVVAGTASAEDCGGIITADEAVRAEDARYAAQIANDVAAMEKLFGPELVYLHSSAVVNNKAAYIDLIKSGRIKYRTMKRSDVTVRTYGCVAVISGIAEFGVTFGGQDRTVVLRFHSIWAKRPDGVIQFVSGQATGIPAKQ